MARDDDRTRQDGQDRLADETLEGTTPGEKDAFGSALADELDRHLFAGLSLDESKKREWSEMIMKQAGEEHGGADTGAEAAAEGEWRAEEQQQMEEEWQAEKSRQMEEERQVDKSRPMEEDRQVDKSRQTEEDRQVDKSRAAGQRWAAGPQRRPRRRGIWGALAAAIVLLGIGIPLLVSQTGPSSMPGGTVNGPDGGGTSLSQLVTEEPGTLEEASQKFGQPVDLPQTLLDGYRLVRIQATGYPGEPALRVHYEFETADGGQLVYTADKQEAFYPADLFEPVELGEGVTGVLFAQPTLTELYWKAGDIQYSIVGAISGEEAAALAREALTL